MFVNPSLAAIVAGYTDVRGTSVEDGVLVFNGGNVPQANLDLATPLEAGRTYSFSGVAADVEGALSFIPPGGPAYEIGNDPIRFTAIESGDMVVFRGQTGTTGRLSGFSLTD